MIRRFLVAALAVLALPAVLLAADSISDLGFDEIMVKNALFSNLRGWGSAPRVPSEVRALPTEQKVAAVNLLGAFAKSYFASAEFKKEYATAYKQGKPKTGFGLPKVNLRDIAERAAEKAVLGEKKDQQGLDKDPNVQLKRRLQAFLETTADVDFAAKTTGSGSMRRFADEAYESKPSEWKMCFRAGPEVTKAVRAFAEEWLAELP